LACIPNGAEMNITPQDLVQITGARINRAKIFAPLINSEAPQFDINTKERMTAFIAQVGHESGGFRWLTELWGPTDAQKRYEGRVDLGNLVPGDGFRYRGRGLIQITGRSNYQKLSDALATDFIQNPNKLADPLMAVRSAMWFWQSHWLNESADRGDFRTCTRIINGGFNGYTERLAMFQKAQRLLA